MGIAIPKPNEVASLDLSPKKSSELSTLFLTYTAPKAGGKTAGVSMIPKPPGSYHYFLTGDENSMNGLVKFHSKRLGSLAKGQQWVDDNCRVYEMTKYYDPTDLSTARTSKKYIREVFERVKTEGDAGLVCGLWVEHYDVMYTNIGVDLIRENNNLDKDEMPHYTQYAERSQLLDPVDSLFEMTNCAIRGIVGYGEEMKEVVVPTGEFYTGPGGKKIEKTKVEKKIDLPTYIKKRNMVRNSQVRIDAHRVRTETDVGGVKSFSDKFLATVLTSQYPHFDEGVTMDITGKGLLPFFDGWFAPRWDGQKWETKVENK